MTKKSGRIETLRALKQEGHDVIDRIVRLHVKRETVYILLAHNLGVSEAGAHFQNMFTIRDCTKAITMLEAMERDRRHELAQRREQRRKDRAAIADYRPPVRMPWWKEMLIKMGILK